MRSALEHDEGTRSAAAEQVDGAARELEAAIDALIGA
jgi:hypothetical protein